MFNRKRSLLMSAPRYPIYGASWDGAATPTLTRTDAAVGLVANAGVDATPVVNDFDSIYPWSEMRDVEIDGNIFVDIPPTYFKITNPAPAWTWQASRSAFLGAWLPEPMKGGKHLLVGKYMANLDDGGTKLESKTGKYPLYNKTIVEMRTAAVANGAGYYQMDIHAVNILQMLFYIEFATLNSQSIMAGLTAGAYDDTHLAKIGRASCRERV